MESLELIYSRLDYLHNMQLKRCNQLTLINISIDMNRLIKLLI